ncbi:hypothetical protein ALC53_07632 [Atta colombica]|uniref:Uncharacterized protein n=1 Tax=Atta colombica TaxID=520822 RepID=A0A195BCB6_9HYME|nr:hypothetical protein ALC53_07632 [Atta colombica]
MQHAGSGVCGRWRAVARRLAPPFRSRRRDLGPSGSCGWFTRDSGDHAGLCTYNSLGGLKDEKKTGRNVPRVATTTTLLSVRSFLQTNSLSRLLFSFPIKFLVFLISLTTYICVSRLACRCITGSLVLCWMFCMLIANHRTIIKSKYAINILFDCCSASRVLCTYNRLNLLRQCIAYFYSNVYMKLYFFLVVTFEVYYSRCLRNDVKSKINEDPFPPAASINYENGLYKKLFYRT